MSEEIKYCEDCKHLDGTICRNPEIKSVVKRDRKPEFLAAWKTRSCEWACGASGKYFEAVEKEEEEALWCLSCGNKWLIVKHFDDPATCFVCMGCGFTCSIAKYEDDAITEYNRLIDKVFAEPVSKETDKPIISLALWARHKNAKWIAMDNGGRWYCYDNEPETAEGIWVASGLCQPLDLDYRPAFTGDWKDSKLCRPDGG